MNHAHPARRSKLLPVLLLALAAITLTVGGAASQAHGGTVTTASTVIPDGTETGLIPPGETHW
ncbi:hypothetical protein ACL07V_07490 [Streptomyces sp. MB22_4]|uniref:hypothetical protein n=1 Tax=Streptomyces sp. MB22_4 TaxID=3383120 RepID=UPI0039A22CD9